MRLSIVADENIPAVQQYLGALGEVCHVDGRHLGRPQLAQADILLVRSVTRVDAELLAGTPVKFVGTATSGFDHIDREYLARNGIGFAHAPGANANSVVEYVLSAIAAIGGTLEQLFAGAEVGIVGYGHIGKALAARLQALGIRYRVYDPWLQQDTIACAAELDSVLQCDVVSLHAELLRQPPWPSYHLIGRRELQRLRPAALLINASRGPVVDNDALLEHFDGARECTVVLDVWEGEPRIDTALLARVTLGTAHIAGYSLDGKLLATRLLSDAVRRHFGIAPPAMAPRDALAQDTPSLQAPGDASGPALARFLLHSRYDIRADDALLRQALAGAQTTMEQGRAFDELRRSYRTRRELAGSIVAGVSPSQRALVDALGCTPLMRELRQ